MKLTKNSSIATTAWKHNSFAVGKGSKIRYVVLHGDFQLIGGEFIYLFSSSREIESTPLQTIDYDIMYSKHKSIATEGAAVDESWKVFDLRDLEVVCEVGDEYFISVYNGSATGYNFQVDIIFDKPYKRIK